MLLQIYGSVREHVDVLRVDDHDLALRRLNQQLLRNLYIKNNTLHGRWVKTSKSFIRVLFFLILVNPFAPIDLNILIFVLVFQQSRPESTISILLLHDKEQMETSFGPLWFFWHNFLAEFEVERVFFLTTSACESDVGWGKIDFLFSDVHERHFEEESVFALGPPDDRMSALNNTYSMSWSH